MEAHAGQAPSSGFDMQALRHGASSVRHPLTRALLVLTFTTGLVDAVSYLALGRVFTANMTGNVVLLGFGLARSGGLPVLAPVLSLASFLVGSGAGGLVIRRTRDHPRLVTVALGVEVSALALAAVVAATTHVQPGEVAAYVLIVLMAFAMGLRNAAVRHIGVPDLTTTVLTMTLTALAAESPPAGGDGQGSLRRITAAVTMFAGALIGALLLKVTVALPLALASALALATWLVYTPAARRLGRPSTPRAAVGGREPRSSSTP